MKYRKAELKDIPELNLLSIASKKYWGYPDEWIEYWRDDMTITTKKFGQQNILIGELNSEMIGFCSVTEHDEQYEILHLWILPQFIGQGYGKKIMTQAIQEFTKPDKPIIVEADPYSELFYAGQGFVTFDKVESYPKGRFLPIMKKSNYGTDQKKELTPKQHVLPAGWGEELLNVLKARFEKNINRHPSLEWPKIRARLEAIPEKLWSLNEMEKTGGEPDVVGLDNKSGEYIFFDCSAESPKGRRSVCYDHKALESRKEHKPKNSAARMAVEMGIELLTEEQYRQLQQLGDFDTKTSSWIKTPVDIRKLGGALFCDRRYDTVFTYHNGAESYYAARGFRGFLRV